MKLDAIFLSPHPDDVELFCGGTVAKLAARSRAVMLADLSAGELASNGTPQTRRIASLKAAQVLGARPERPSLGFPDGGIDERDAGQLEALVRLLREYPTRMLFAPWPADRHPDHVAAGLLARRAVFFAGLRSYLPSVPAHRVQALIHYPCHHDAPVNFVVDTGAQMEIWRKAVHCYPDQFESSGDSQPTPINRPEFLPSQEARRREWGRRGGCSHAEAFAIEGLPRLNDPLDLLLEEGSL